MMKKRRKIKFVLDDDEYVDVYTKAQLRRTKEYWKKHSKWRCKWCSKKFKAIVINGWGYLGPCCIKCYLKNCEVRVKKVKKVKKKRKIKFVLD